MLKKRVDIGFIIRKVFLERKKSGKITVEKFAKELGCERSRIYPTIFNKMSIDTDLLVRISKILDYPFLLEYFEEDKPIVVYLALIEIDSLRMEEMKEDPTVKIIQTWSSV